MARLLVLPFSFSFTLLFYPTSYILVNRVQKELCGAADERAKAILELPQERFDLKTLSTKEHLKKIGLLDSWCGIYSQTKVQKWCSFETKDNRNTSWKWRTQRWWDRRCFRKWRWYREGAPSLDAFFYICHFSASSLLHTCFYYLHTYLHIFISSYYTILWFLSF